MENGKDLGMTSPKAESNLFVCKKIFHLVERNNASLPDILDIFQKYQNRVAIFHYGGHADGYQLILETAEGNQHVHAGDLVSFLGRQKGLKLVFLP